MDSECERRGEWHYKSALDQSNNALLLLPGWALANFSLGFHRYSPRAIDGRGVVAFE